MTLRKFCICIFCTMILIGCATGSASRLNDVKLGMSEAEVIAAIGAPSTKSASGDTAYLHYQLYSSGLFPDDYFVRLTDGKVDAYGRKGDFNLGY